MTSKKIVSLLGGLLLSAIPFAAVADDSWMSRPDIVEIRKIYQRVNGGIQNKSYQKLTKTMPGDQCEGEEERSVWLDAGGRVVAYRTEGSLEHIHSTETRYYDHSGAMRFLFAEVDSYHWSYNGVDKGESRTQYRIYLNERGMVVHEDRRVIKRGNTLLDHTEGFRERLSADPRALFNETCK